MINVDDHDPREKLVLLILRERERERDYWDVLRLNKQKQCKKVFAWLSHVGYWDRHQIDQTNQTYTKMVVRLHWRSCCIFEPVLVAYHFNVTFEKSLSIPFSAENLIVIIKRFAFQKRNNHMQHDNRVNRYSEPVWLLVETSLSLVALRN